MMLQGVADGASTPEFKEIHSTMQEKWGRHTLSTYARHHQTGEKVPQSLLDAFERSMSFYESFAKVRLLQNALFDLTFHKTPAADYKGVEDTQARALLDHPGIMHARPYPLTRFGHLFEDAQSQYAAGYYGYFWADIYAAHGFAKFMQSGDIYDPALSGALKAFYMRGGALPSAAIYAGFAPEGANASAMMREIGLKDEPAAPKPPTLHA
jgi:peptidyl-dipeptidase Dcp